MGSDPSSVKDDDLPVTDVSWYDVQVFIKNLNALTGRNYCLPTEAEWEFAARGGNKTQGYKFSGSNNADEVAWFDNNSGDGMHPHPVGAKQPNELGIHDMSGNAWEWCSDWYGRLPASAQRDPAGASSGSRRMIRGGSWYSYERYCRVDGRYNIPPDYRHFHYGFRLVCDAEQAGK